MQSSELKLILEAGAFLAGSTRSEQASDLKSVLSSRLAQYYECLSRQSTVQSATLEELQLETGREAFFVIQQVHNLQKHSDVHPSADASDASAPQQESSMISLRSLVHIRTLLSLVFKWAIEPLLSRVTAAIPTTAPGGRRTASLNIIDLTNVPEDYNLLTSLIAQLLEFVLPNDRAGPSSPTVVTSMLLDRPLLDLLKPCITLGWLPKPLATESIQPLDHVRPAVMHLMSIRPVSEVVTALSGILSDVSTASYVRKTCSFLLSRQLLRRDGVRGTFVALFSDEDASGEDAPLEKLEHVSKLLKAVPAGMKDVPYYESVVPQILAIISADSNEAPPAHRRAAAFCISRMLATDRSSPHHALASQLLLPKIQQPFLRNVGDSFAAPSDDASHVLSHITPAKALFTLQALLTNTDPSPTLISSLLTPIIPSLYALLAKMEGMKTADPALKASIRGFLGTWGRLVGATEGTDSLWSIINGEGGEWQIDVAGEITRTEAETRPPSLSLFTPEGLQQAEASGEFDVDANILDLRPDPVKFVQYLKSIDRSDITSELFVKLLEAYRELKSTSDADPLRTLLYLQIIMQIQSQLSSDSTSSNILKRPDHILSFVKHALESANSAPVASSSRRHRESSAGLTLEDLRIVEDEEEELDEFEESDSDDEDGVNGSATGGTSDEEMTATAVNLLLSILEANPDLSARTAPILNDIFSLLEPLAKESSETVKPLAREARMVMTARLASSSVPASSKMQTKNTDEESPQEIYQKALKLLQDPLLPVRAHGLLLLRQLVSARSTKSGAIDEPSIDRALVPAILSIFMQSAQDDDSYIFLNAVQGLAAMVDGFGKDVLKGLVDSYAQGLDGVAGTAMTQQEMDTRTRVGEALGQVIKRSGDALPNYINMLVPPLFRVLRTRHLPTTLRTSALSLLAQCATTSSLAILPYAVDLSEAMIDLLQFEMVPAAHRPRTRAEEGTAEDHVEEQPPATMDSEPTSTNSKFPPLRRAALHFLSLLTRAFMRQVIESPTRLTTTFTSALVRRAKNTVGYVAANDEDAVVRVMARETLEGLDRLTEAMMGF